MKEVDFFTNINKNQKGTNNKAKTNKKRGKLIERDTNWYWERERERECVCVCVWKRERERDWNRGVGISNWFPYKVVKGRSSNKIDTSIAINACAPSPAMCPLFFTLTALCSDTGTWIVFERTAYNQTFVCVTIERQKKVKVERQMPEHFRWTNNNKTKMIIKILGLQR